MIRVLLVDDHPSVRAGLQAVLRLEPGLVPVGEAVTAAEGIHAAQILAPDVVVADYHLPDQDGLAMCARLKTDAPARHVLIFSAYARSGLVLPAIVAGADGLLDKTASAGQLFDAIRLVARGEYVFPRITPVQLRAAARRLTPDELPVFAMLLDHVPSDEIADILAIQQAEVEASVHTILRRLSPRTAVPAG